MREKCTAIVLAAGQGRRMGSKVPKQFMVLRDHPVLYYSLQCFQECEWIQDILVVTNRENLDYVRATIAARYHLTKVRKILAGGKERLRFRLCGACGNVKTTDYVFIHDGARPLLDQKILERTLAGVRAYGACVAGMPSERYHKNRG